MGASTMLNRVSSLVNAGKGERLDDGLRNTIQEEYKKEEDGILNIKGGKYLNNLYENNEEFGNEIVNLLETKQNMTLK